MIEVKGDFLAAYPERQLYGRDLRGDRRLLTKKPVPFYVSIRRPQPRATFRNILYEKSPGGFSVDN